MILVIDNYDSFTYNLVQYCWEQGAQVEVHRNDQITLEQISQMKPAGILISPGPGHPVDAGFILDIIRGFYQHIPILGVCLGHQAIGAAFGGQVIRAPQIFHGKISSITHDQSAIFHGINSPFKATRYHSLIVSQDQFPSAHMKVTAQTSDGLIMALAHNNYPVYGVQFHPESILTEHGKEMIANFLAICAPKFHRKELR